MILRDNVDLNKINSVIDKIILNQIQSRKENEKYMYDEIAVWFMVSGVLTYSEAMDMTPDEIYRAYSRILLD